MTRIELQLWGRLLRGDYIRLRLEQYDLQRACEAVKLDTLYGLDTSRARRVYRRIRRTLSAVGRD